MKKFLASLLAVTILAIALIPSVFAADDVVKYAESDKITIQVVDKNSVAVANAYVAFPYDAKWEAVSEYTDMNGNIRLYKNDDYDPSVSKNRKYSVHVIMRTPTDGKLFKDTYVKEVFTVDLDNKKVGSVTVIKLKNADTKAKVYEAKDRTDFYIKNTKGGPVRNMKVTLHPSQVPQTIGNYTVDDVHIPDMLTGYTDNDGRVTFLKVPVDHYTVKFSWLNGACENNIIEVNDKSGISVYDLVFDETLLEKK